MLSLRGSCSPCPADPTRAGCVDDRSYLEIRSERLQSLLAAVFVVVVALTPVQDQPRVAGKLFDTLDNASINIRLIATSEVKVSCLLAGQQGKKALRAAAEITELPEHQLNRMAILSDADAEPVLGVALDLDQAQVCVRRLPNRPRSAAVLCKALAEARVSIELIARRASNRWSQCDAYQLGLGRPVVNRGEGIAFPQP